MNIEVILTPSELPALAQRDLRDAACVVFDILRATSTFVTALHQGAKAIVPVSEIAEALAFRSKQPEVLLGGERDGLKIGPALTGGVDFDLGNSPRECTPEKVRGKIIVATTTNGTRALRACAGADAVLAASFLNLTATARYLAARQPKRLVLVGAGTRQNPALEDVLAAGALCETLAPSPAPVRIETGRAAGLPEQFVSANDAVEIARCAWRQAQPDLAEVIATSENARRLRAIPELRQDIPFCLQLDAFSLVAKLGTDGWLRKA